MRSAFAHRRIREGPPSGGVSVYRESVPADPELLEAGEIDCIMWNFVATAERAARFALTRPYGGTDMALLVRHDAQITGIDDLAGRPWALFAERPTSSKLGGCRTPRASRPTTRA